MGLDFGRESRLTTDEDKCFEISGHIERMNVEEGEELRAVKERKKRERINKRFLSLFCKGRVPSRAVRGHVWGREGAFS